MNLGTPPATPRWPEQWARLGRWFERFREIDCGTEHRRPGEYYVDDVHAFFMNCLHLKDWLTNDPSSGLTKADLKPLTTRSTSLQLCADLANGVKHLDLKREYWVAHDTHVGRHLVEVDDHATAPEHAIVRESSPEGEVIWKRSSEAKPPPPPPPPTIAIKFDVEAGGRTYDAFHVASDCMGEWRDYLRDKGLL
jgi:hypothetical protein